MAASVYFAANRGDEPEPAVGEASQDSNKPSADRPPSQATLSEDWRRLSKLNELTNRETGLLASEQWNANKTAYSQSIVTCVSTGLYLGEGFPDLKLAVSIGLFDENKNPLSLLWRWLGPGIMSVGHSETEVSLTRDGGKTLDAGTVWQGDYTNNVTFNLDYFIDSQKFAYDWKPVSGDFRIQLTSQDGRTIVVRIPVESSGIFKAFAEGDCPHRDRSSDRPAAPSQGGEDAPATSTGAGKLASRETVDAKRYTTDDIASRFGNTIVTTDSDGQEIYREYFDSDGTVNVVTKSGAVFRATWVLEGDQLCVTALDKSSSKRCRKFYGSKLIGDVWKDHTNSGAEVTVSLQEGRP